MRVPTASGSAELEKGKSLFLSQAGFFDRPDDIKRVKADLRIRHEGCSHVVYAYAVGDDGDIHGMSDDREPKGTAGRPVLEVVKGSGVTNLLITVVRFFGGTKLGMGGLVRAYTEAAQLALTRVRTEALVARVSFELDVPYALYDSVKRLIGELSGTKIDERFEESVTISGLIPAIGRDRLTNSLADLSGGTLRLRLL